MKVLWLRPSKPDDVSIGRHRIAVLLRERGHEVTVQDASVGSFRDVLDADPDVVVGTTRLGAIVGAWKRIVHETPFVVDHIDPISQFRETSGPIRAALVSQLEKLAFRVSGHVLVVYEEELSRVQRYADNVTKTDLGVDYERFVDPTEASIKEAQRFLTGRLDPEKKTVVYIGGLEPNYNLNVVIEAMDYLDGWQFLVLGDGSQREQIEKAARRSEDVIYPGTVDHELIPGVLHCSDVGINLCDDRNTLKILEYGAAGLPAVNVEGDAEQRFDRLVEFCSLMPSDVARAISAASESSAEGLQSFAEQFSWRSITDTYERVLKSVLN
jgi:glycosyltransferase involved in cell wall biosynthesis